MKKAQNTPTITATPVKAFSKKLPKLTKKQTVFVKQILENPKHSATEAAVIAYDVKNRNVARVIATENLAKPAIISHLDNAKDLVEDVIQSNITTFRESSTPWERQLSNDNAKWVHDKIFGKATQRTESTSVNVNIEAMLNELL